jgi:hypothetical protein
MLEIIALRTDECRRRMAEFETIGRSFVVVGFSLGNAGHDPLDPSSALTPDPGSTECQSVVFGPKATSGFTYANDSCPVWEGLVDMGEGVSLFSSVCLIAQIIFSPIPGDPEVGTTFLHSVANLPQRPKFDSELLLVRVGISG